MLLKRITCAGLLALCSCLAMAPARNAPMNPAPQDPHLTDEERRDLMALVKSIPSGHFSADQYNPLSVLRIVNALRPLGKEDAIHLIRQSHGGGAELICRFLFEPPAGETHPTLYTGYKEFLNSDFPTYPAIELAGVPLYPMIGFSGSGNFPSDHFYLDWYLEHGTMRAEPMRPVDDPLVVWRAWLDSDLRVKLNQKSSRQSDNYDRVVALQLLRLIETVHVREFDDDTVSFQLIMSLWQSAEETLRATETRWDEELNYYVRAEDGSYSIPIDEQQYRLFSWTLPIDGRTAHLRVQRISETVISVMADNHCNSKGDVPDCRVRLFDASDPTREIDTFEIDGAFMTGYWNTSRNVELEKGVDVRAVLLRDGKEIARSPIMFVDREAR